MLDNGQPRKISDFRAEPSPISLAILFDISGSMRTSDRLLAARFAAHHVLSWLEPGRDEAALFTFDSRLHEVAPFTVDTRALQGALGEVDPFGATSLHDAVAQAAHRAAARTGRRRAVGDHRRHRYLSGLTRVKCRVLPARSMCRSTSSRRCCRSITPAARLGRRAPERPVDGGTVEDLATWTGGAFLREHTCRYQQRRPAAAR